MVDNSWIESDRSSGGSSKLTRTKVYLTIGILIFGGIGTVLLHGLGSDATLYQSEGVIIDFGEYSTVWTDVDYNETSDPKEMLKRACDEHYGTEPVFTDGLLTSIETKEKVVKNDDTHSWGLWYVEKTQFDFVKSESYTIDASEYTAVCWAYTTETGTPTVAVDATGTSVYGYAQPRSMTSLSPVCTEIIGAMNATSLITGMDSYSDYPHSVIDAKDKGLITITGTYTNPSYEAILSVAPDMVICDSSQKSHVDMAAKLRSSEMNSVVIYDGKDLKTTLDNIFIVGTAMKYELRAQEVIYKLEYALDQIFTAINGHGGQSVIVALSAETTPYIAGSANYMDDIITQLQCENKGAPCGIGWPNPTVESYIQDINPQYAIIMDSSYSADEYDIMLNNMSQEWKNTDAYKNGRIYLFSEDFGSMAQRSGPRIAQLTEVMARILDPAAFTDGIIIPNAVGSHYDDLLTFTKNLGFGD